MYQHFTLESFQAQFEQLLVRLPAGILHDYRFITVPCNQAPWLDSGMAVAKGDQLSSFAVGRTCLKDSTLWFGASLQLWFRIGTEGEVFRGARSSQSFTAPQTGSLHLGSYFPGEWANRQGQLAIPEEAYQTVEGELLVLIVRWQVEPITGLRQLVGLGDVQGLITQEIDRLEHPVPTPTGWEYLWFVGPAEIYRPCNDHEQTICCHTRNDVGLLHKDVHLPLTPSTCLHWTWRMEALPSNLREDVLANHDYLSIAVEFDNGQDLTYYWSAELPTETAYRCPIPTWTARETHLVVRSGPTGMGEWQAEQRNVFADYQTAIGGELPSQIVRVWLIAVSLFQHGEGKCQYREIAVISGEQKLNVL